MKIHRFFVTELPSEDSVQITDGALVRQIKTILALKPTEVFELCDGQGNYVQAAIEAYEKNAIRCSIVDRIAEPDTVRHVTAYIAILKRDNFELVIQKLTEIGVAKIVPVISAHTVKTALNMRRLQTIAKEAAELAGRTRLPEIVEPQEFKNAIKTIPANTYFFDASGTSAEPHGANAFMIGPEGGWTADEIAAAAAAGCKNISLGKLTLRGETAAIIAGYLSIQ